jgi:hypothetical protein
MFTGSPPQTNRVWAADADSAVEAQLTAIGSNRSTQSRNASHQSIDLRLHPPGLSLNCRKTFAPFDRRFNLGDLLKPDVLRSFATGK